jgi:hypothetical protein
MPRHSRNAQDPMTGVEVDTGPEWSTWRWDQLSLPASALESLLGWLESRPHGISPSYATAERIFLAVGLLILEPEKALDLAMWLNTVDALTEEMNSENGYRLMR